jgi:predicted DNA-binding antitoxin AbrB/MazE fold protein
MSITVEAIYEGGVLKPASPLPLAENEKVQVTVEQAYKPIWQRALELVADATPEELDKLPVDGASQHDHYIYGLPKKPE